MRNILNLKQDQPWLSGSGNVILGVPNLVNVTLYGEDGGHVSGVPLSFLTADSSLVRAMLLTHNEGEKHITLMSETHYEAEPFEMSAGKKVNTREQPETNFICLSCYIEEHL